MLSVKPTIPYSLPFFIGYRSDDLYNNSQANFTIQQIYEYEKNNLYNQDIDFYIADHYQNQQSAKFIKELQKTHPYGLWLCESPKDLIESYPTLKQQTDEIDQYIITDYIILSHVGPDGYLVALKQPKTHYFNKTIDI